APTARPTKGFRADYGFVATLDDEIRRDLEREDTDEIYERLDDAQDDRVIASSRPHMTDTASKGADSAKDTARDADRIRNGKDSHDSGMGVRRQAPPAYECSYQDFMKCNPLYFKGTEGVNSHIMTVGPDVSYAINWTNLRKKMTYKYCPRDKIKKLEVELWNLKVKGTDVVSYNQRIQELTLKCAKMFREESDKIERYIGGLADMIHGSVMASMPKTMQDVIVFTTKLMDKKINTFAERQAEKKRKFKDTLKNNQNQQQNKRQNTGRATLQDLLIRNLTEVLSHYALNATITMIVSVLQNTTSATGLAIRLVTIGVLQVPILLTTKRVLGQFRSLHALSV
nr:hypothetical protein [Tanacetum cinerariifolium]